ncbi:MAG: SDR family NAD(P)-dependent oxidoreductase [Erythrobacter sp.]|jgi:NAD(P)-dependent dehydrogenase (short-subunit alcohol dehydrogenase family)|uniref:SDR family NAD(P)-dependent oxidoreductase n=1 Tax=Erythrobacter sp. TaxID=1042 RepID=UPI002B488F8B|nr:SDR family NAD(P)-dependent oxidoreductase [Erythrobacter sp.]WRH69990.1 MAG: SDR family NAD(P)-dependent oxidoreductase [Erythrobacter sp.]
MSGFGWSSTTDEVLAGKDLSGRTVFITGANSGLGQETARAMASRGAHVILAGRDQAKLDESVAAIQETVPKAQLDTITIDLTSLENIRAATSRARQRFQKIDLLINNAGVMATPFLHTHDGFEMQFGTNHLGHFAMTAELMPLIERGALKRIVNLSSRGHHFAPVNFDDPHFERRAYDPWESYGHSKTANVLFSVGLEQRFAVMGIHAYAVHPGGIQTNLGRHMTPEMMEALMARVTSKDAGFAWKTIPQGAATSCWAATAEELEGKGGVYCEDCHVAEVDDESSTGGVRSYALNPSFADRLWKLSEELTGAKFPS